jgi:hypothetical protein
MDGNLSEVIFTAEKSFVQYKELPSLWPKLTASKPKDKYTAYLEIQV